MVDVVSWMLLVAGPICIFGSIVLGVVTTPKGTRGVSRLVAVRSYEGRGGSFRLGLLLSGIALLAAHGVVVKFGLSPGSFVRALVDTVRNDFVLADWLWVIGAAIGSLILIIVVTGDGDEPPTNDEPSASVESSLLHLPDADQDSCREPSSKRALTVACFPLFMAAVMIFVVAGGKLGVL